MEQPRTKAVVTITEMARMVGLSPARFRQLMGSTFPSPLYSVATRRPFYSEDMQVICLDVRRRNCGIDGRPVLFYCRRGGEASAPRKFKTIKPTKNEQHGELLDGLRALGLTTVTSDQIATAIKTLYPNGVTEVDRGGVLRTIFLHLKQQNRSVNVGL
jgi:hypothetical protein